MKIIISDTDISSIELDDNEDDNCFSCKKAKLIGSILETLKDIGLPHGATLFELGDNDAFPKGSTTQRWTNNRIEGEKRSVK